MTARDEVAGAPQTRLLEAWMSAVADVVRAVNAAEPLDALLGRIAEQACRLIGFDYCAVMLADPSRTWLLVRGSHGLDPDYVAALNREHTLVLHPTDPDDDTITARAYRDGATLAVPDLAAVEGHGATRRWARLQGFGALLATPMRGADGAVGVVVAYSGRPRGFGGSEIELVELLAQHAVLALETAELRALQLETITELEHKRQVLERAEAQHRGLMELLLDEAGLPRLAGSLAAALRVSIVVEDVEGAVLAIAPDTARAPSGRWRRRPGVRAALRALHERYEVAPVEADTEHGAAWVAPVVLGGQLVGRIWGTGVAALPEPFECRIIERFALVVAVELLTRRHRLDTENRLVGDLVAELLRTGTAQLPPVTVQRAAVLGHDLTGPQVLAVVTAADPARLVDALRWAAVGPPSPLVGVHDAVVVVILPADPDPVPVLTALHERAVGIAGPRVTTLLGPPVTGGFAEAFAVALGGARLCPPGGTGRVLDLRELGLAAHLLRAGTSAELAAFVDALLAPIEGHDARRGAHLCDTLRAWLATGCSVPATARELTVHPNTVAYRLHRVEQLLGRDLGTTAVRMELQLAFTVRDIQQVR